MSSFVIEGGYRLSGTIRPQGAKNEALEVICAVLLTKEEVVISNVPEILDVRNLILLLEGIGVKVKRLDKGKYSFQADDLDTSYVESAEFVRKCAALRGSVMIAGPLLARLGHAYFPKPGGDKIGRRRVDTHISGMLNLGASLHYDEQKKAYYLHIPAGTRLKGSYMLLDEASVTGTANILMASVLAEGRTVIYNAACEPYIQQLSKMLVRMGAKIEGAGTPVITVHGVERLHGAEHSVVPDRIEAGSFLIAGIVTRGDVLVTHCVPAHMDVLLAKLREAGADIVTGPDWVRARMTERPRAVSVRTMPHPGFPTDMQAQFMTLDVLAEGTSSITETIFENRFMHVPELQRLGARISISDHTAVVEGVEKLSGATVMATDLRASASLVIAALAAEGESTVDRIYHLDRGYEHMETKLRALGADIVRVSE